MQNDIARLLRALPAAIPPQDMTIRIQVAILEQARLQGVKLRLSAFASGFVALLATVVSFWSVFMVELSSSSFTSYLRLIWTDTDAALANWQDVSLSLLESLPVANLMVWLLLAFFACGMGYMFSQMRWRGVGYGKALMTV